MGLSLCDGPMKTVLGAPHTLNHTTPFPHFLQTSPGSTQTRSFSIQSLPVESPQVIFLITTSKISSNLIEPQLLPCTTAWGYKFHALTVHLPPPPPRHLQHLQSETHVESSQKTVNVSLRILLFVYKPH